jgi:hypothetical protein
MFLLILGACVVTSLPNWGHDHNRSRRRPDRAHHLTTLFLTLGLEKNGYPPYSGRAFVLSLLTYRLLDPLKEESLDVFFMDGEDTSRRPSPAEYAALTRERLAAGGDFSRFTSFLGRRNADPDVGPPEPGSADALFAWLEPPDLAVVGFVSGRVYDLDREGLGLGPDDPLIVGPKSRSPILRQLGE